MRKNIIKFLSLFLMGILFLTSACTSEPVSDVIQGRRIAIGGYEGLFVDDAGKVWFFDGRPEFIEPKAVMNEGRFVYTHDMGNTYYVIRKDGSLWGWGWSYSGELGIQTESPFEKVELRQILTSVRSIAVTKHNVFAIKTDGSLWAWGGWLSLGDDRIEKSTATPHKIMDQVKLVSASSYHVFALKEDGSLWGWGSNQCGGVGDGTTEQRLTPQKVDVTNLQGRKIVRVAANLGDSYAVTEDGLLWFWGNRHFGRLTCMDQPVLRPTLVEEIDNVKDIALGHADNAILKKDGTVWLINYQETHYPDKHKLIMQNVQEIAAAKAYFLALKKDGRVWMWTRNSGYGFRESRSPHLNVEPIFFPKEK